AQSPYCLSRHLPNMAGRGVLRRQDRSDQNMSEAVTFRRTARHQSVLLVRRLRPQNIGPLPTNMGIRRRHMSMLKTIAGLVTTPAHATRTIMLIIPGSMATFLAQLAEVTCGGLLAGAHPGSGSEDFSSRLRLTM